LEFPSGEAIVSMWCLFVVAILSHVFDDFILGQVKLLLLLNLLPGRSGRAALPARRRRRMRKAEPEGLLSHPIMAFLLNDLLARELGSTVSLP
jgi:hypothetical protein